MSRINIQKAFGELRSLAAITNQNERQWGLTKLLGELSLSEPWEVLDTQLIPYLLSHDIWRPHEYHPIYDKMYFTGPHPYNALRRTFTIHERIPQDPRLKNLTNLTIVGPLEKGQEVSAYTLAQGFPHLKTLTLIELSFNSIVIPETIENLSLTRCTLRGSIAPTPNLKTLSLQRVEVFWQDAFGYMPRLKALKIAHSNLPCPGHEWNFRAPNLETLFVDQSDLEARNFLGQPWPQVTRISCLDTRWAMAVSRALRDYELKPCFPHLKRIDMRRGFFNFDPFCTTLRSGVRFMQEASIQYEGTLQVEELENGQD